MEVDVSREQLGQLQWPRCRGCWTRRWRQTASWDGAPAKRWRPSHGPFRCVKRSPSVFSTTRRLKLPLSSSAQRAVRRCRLWSSLVSADTRRPATQQIALHQRVTAQKGRGQRIGLPGMRCKSDSGRVRCAPVRNGERSPPVSVQILGERQPEARDSTGSSTRRTAVGGVRPQRGRRQTPPPPVNRTAAGQSGDDGVFLNAGAIRDPQGGACGGQAGVVSRKGRCPRSATAAHAPSGGARAHKAQARQRMSACRQSNRRLRRWAGTKTPPLQCENPMNAPSKPENPMNPSAENTPLSEARPGRVAARLRSCPVTNG